MFEWISHLPVKQFILLLEQELHFGLMDLDDTHLLLFNLDCADIMETIQKRLDQLHDQNTYELNSEGRDKLFRIEY